MKISDVIQKVKDYHQGVYQGKIIDESITRDQILFGKEFIDQECISIATCIWASVDVIKMAISQNVNLIIAHEALFYNHGDHQEWLIETNNRTYNEKIELLMKHKIVVWRCHDYIHSGIPMNGTYVDGIFYGVAHKLGWVEYIRDDICKPLRFEIPETTTVNLVNHLENALNLNGVRIYGDMEAKVSKVSIARHIFGDANELIELMDKDEIDCFLSMEIVDYTLSEYVIDSAMLNHGKAIISMGHFNLEEYGMEYMLQYLDTAIGEHIPAQFITTGDMYHYHIKG